MSPLDCTGQYLSSAFAKLLRHSRRAGRSDDLKMATQNYFNKFLHPEIDPRGSLGSYRTTFDCWLLQIILEAPEERDGLIIYAME